jgi:hypothetical protein
LRSRVEASDFPEIFGPTRDNGIGINVAFVQRSRLA